MAGQDNSLPRLDPAWVSQDIYITLLQKPFSLDLTTGLIPREWMNMVSDNQGCSPMAYTLMVPCPQDLLLVMISLKVEEETMLCLDLPIDPVVKQVSLLS